MNSRGIAVWPKNAEQSFARRGPLKSMTSKIECNNEVTGPQADVSGIYPRNALQAASNPKSHVLRQIEYFYHTASNAQHPGDLIEAEPP
jgi:hypothetical protein